MRDDLPTIASDDIRQLQALIASVELQNVRPAYIALVQKLRNAGLAVSDRRAVKLQRLLAASALLCKRNHVIPSDFWVLRYIWDTEEQREVIASIVNAAVDADPDKQNQHPRASQSASPDADEIHREVLKMTEAWENPETPIAERSLIKDRLRYLNGRAEWIVNDTQRLFVQGPMNALWEKILRSS